MKKIINVIHHSHTDIGYTDTQARIIKNQVNYLKDMVLKYQDQPQAFYDWKWVCESFFIVEKFLEKASAKEIAIFQTMVSKQIISLSGSYLNLAELASPELYASILERMRKLGKHYSLNFDSAMCNDVNGFSLGYAKALVENKVDNLYFGLHSHHGMYPAFKKQAPFYWEIAKGKKILVWIGEHYMFGNDLAIVDAPMGNYILQSDFENGYFEEEKQLIESKKRLLAYLDSLAKTDYQFQNIPVAVSGANTDNAPFNLTIKKRIEKLNKFYEKEQIEFKMVTLEQFFANIKAEKKDIPTYQGDWPDWWSDGAGSTPQSTRLFRAAQRNYHLIKKLNIEHQLIKKLEEKLILYSEHTWGAWSSVENPFQIWALNMAKKKEAFASEALSLSEEILDDYTKYWVYKLEDKNKINLKLRNPFMAKVPILINLAPYLSHKESQKMAQGFEVIANEQRMPTFTFNTYYMDIYPQPQYYALIAEPQEKMNIQIKLVNKQKRAITFQSSTRGADGIDDIHNIFNDQDVIIQEQCFENDFIKIKWNNNQIYSMIAKETNEELLKNSLHGLFSPIYEKSEVPYHYISPGMVRKVAGRNRRGNKFKQYVGKLDFTKIIVENKDFTIIEFVYQLNHVKHYKLTLKIVNKSRTISAKVQFITEADWAIQNFYVSLPFDTPQTKILVDKGELIEIWKDQIPGTLIDYYAIQEGLILKKESGLKILIGSPDHNLFWTGSFAFEKRFLAHDKRNQNKPVLYGWLMNNAWETNFSVDISGFHEFNYQIFFPDKENGDRNSLKVLNQAYLITREK